MIDFTGEFVTLTTTDKGNLHIVITGEGRDRLTDLIESDTLECVTLWCGTMDKCDCTDERKQRSIQFGKDHRTIWLDLLDDVRADSDIEFLSDGDIAELGHLTDAPMIVAGYDTGEQGRIIAYAITDTFWFPNYAIESELQTLYTQGFVEFQNANPQPIAPKTLPEPPASIQVRHPEDLIALNPYERANVIAALRLLSNPDLVYMLGRDRLEPINDIATNAGHYDAPMNANELEMLIERLQGFEDENAPSECGTCGKSHPNFDAADTCCDDFFVCVHCKARFETMAEADACCPQFSSVYPFES